MLLKLQNLPRRVVFSIWRKVRALLASSITDDGEYPQFCDRAVKSDKVFATFRTDRIYVRTLENVSCEQGQACLEIINSRPSISSHLETFRENDKIGAPLTYSYGAAGEFAPTTLRYIKILSELEERFGSLDRMRIVEIGVGYGGQCRVICARFRPASYRLVDLAPALALSQKYLSKFTLHTSIDFQTSDQLAVESYDLIISNYAFSELRRQFQDIYLEKIIKNSRRGYMAYNHITSDTFRTYTVNEFAAMITGSKIVPEKPSTHSLNQVVIWGHQ